MAPPAPVIEGTLKSTINCFGFGLIVAVLSVNFGKIFLANYFVYIVGVVVTLEAILFSLYKPRRDYEVYRPPGRRGTHCIGGELQINVEEPEDNASSTSPKKRKLQLKGREKDRLVKKEMKEHQKRRESSLEVSPVRPDNLQLPGTGQSLERTESFGKAGKEAEKAKKEREKAEKKETERAKEPVKSGWRKKN